MVSRGWSCGYRYVLLTLAATVMGCASPGRYEIITAPTGSGDRFEHLVVRPVTVGITTDPLDVSAPAMLRFALVEALSENGEYSSVRAETEEEPEVTPGLLAITCQIDEFEKGSEVGRLFIGNAAGGSHLDVICRFHERESGRLFAEGVFVGESDGLESMIEDVAAAAARFLREES